MGIVHYKDLMRIWEERRFAHESQRRGARPFRLRRFLRKAPVVPETKPLNQLIDEFRKDHTHMALVVDEFGTVVGLVTSRGRVGTDLWGHGRRARCQSPCHFV